MTFIEAHCPSCGHYFRESCQRLTEGQTVACPHCQQAWTLNAASPFDETRSLLASARDARKGPAPRYSLATNRWYA
jgi:transposase-like protein